MKKLSASIKRGMTPRTRSVSLDPEVCLVTRLRGLSASLPEWANLQLMLISPAPGRSLMNIVSE